MNKEECLSVDWYNIGYEDGTRGYGSSRVALNRKACSKYGVIPDLSLYQKWRSEGLAEYCTTALSVIRDLDMQKSRLEAEYQSKEIQIKDMKQTLDDMKNQNRF